MDVDIKAFPRDRDPLKLRQVLYQAVLLSLPALPASPAASPCLVLPPLTALHCSAFHCPVLPPLSLPCTAPPLTAWCEGQGIPAAQPRHPYHYPLNDTCPLVMLLDPYVYMSWNR